jgi:hypothetical protein
MSIQKMQAVVVSTADYMAAIRESSELGKKGILRLVVLEGQEDAAARWTHSPNPQEALVELLENLGGATAVLSAATTQTKASAMLSSLGSIQ